MSQVTTSSAVTFWRCVYGAFALGLVIGTGFGIIGFIILLQMITVMISPV